MKKIISLFIAGAIATIIVAGCSGGEGDTGSTAGATATGTATTPPVTPPVTTATAGDKMGGTATAGDKMGGTATAGDKMGGTATAGDKMGGTATTGDKMGSTAGDKKDAKPANETAKPAPGKSATDDKGTK